MDFKNTAPQWDAEGMKPTEELLKEGFKAGYKPPADYFNYLFHGYSEAINEIQENLNEVDNTADKDKPVSEAQQKAIAAMGISVEAAGSMVSVADSASAPFNALTLHGASKQATTTGKNLFSTILESGLWAFTSKVKTPDPSYVRVADFISVEPSTTYVLSGTAISNFRGNLVFYDETKTYIDQVFSFKTFTTPENAHYVLFHVTVEDTSNIYGTVQMELGTTSTAYEPYTGGKVAPNPDFPQDINSVGDSGSLEVRTTRKNLFQVATGTANGVTLSKINDYYVLNGTCTDSHNFVFGASFELEAGTYTISANNPTNNGLNFNLIDVHSSTLNETLGVLDNANYNKKTKQLPSGKYACRVRIEKGVTYDNFIFKPQLERGDTATNYEPYTETVVTVPLNEPLYGIPVTSGGNYTDENGQRWLCDEIDAARGVLVKRLDIVDMSTMEWQVQANEHATWWVAPLKGMQYVTVNTNKGVALAEKYRIRMATGMSLSSVGEFAVDVADVKVNNGSASEKPTGNMLYALAEPIETPLTEEQLTALYSLRSYEGVTNVFTNDIGGLSVECFKNTDNGRAAGVLKENLNVNVIDLLSGALQVGNAKTLDGHEAEYFTTAEAMGNIDGKAILNEPILEKALSITVDGDYNFKLGGSNYTGNDLPDIGFAYGQATVKVRGGIGNNNNTTVILWGTNTATNTKTIAINYYNGTKWGGWNVMLTTAGGTVTSSSTNAPIVLDQTTDVTQTLTNYKHKGVYSGGIGMDSNGKKPIVNIPDKGLFDLIHTGNGATVEEGTFEIAISSTSTTKLTGFKYYKVGKLVILYCGGDCSTSCPNFTNGSTLVSGLPFPVASYSTPLFGALTLRNKYSPAAPIGNTTFDNKITQFTKTGFYISTADFTQSNYVYTLFVVYITE